MNKATPETINPNLISPEAIFGEVNGHDEILPCTQAFAEMQEALDINSMKPRDYPEDPHAGARVFCVDLPEHLQSKPDGQNEYIRQLAKVAVIYEVNKRIAKKQELTGEPIQYICLDVNKLTADEDNLEVGLSAINSFADRETRGYVFVKDEELNLKDSDGREVLNRSNEPIVDAEANVRLSKIRQALAETSLITFNVLPSGYTISEPTNDERIEFFESHKSLTEDENEPGPDSRTSSPFRTTKAASLTAFVATASVPATRAGQTNLF